MSTEPTKDHDCVRRIDEQLAQHNTQISTAINFKSGELAIQVATSKLDQAKRGKPMSLYATFCPFCGTNLSKGTS